MLLFGVVLIVTSSNANRYLILVVCDEESFTQVKIVVVNNRLTNRWYLSNKEMGRVWQGILYIR